VRVLGTDKAIGVYVAGDGQTDVTLELSPASGAPSGSTQ
jgi:hypothetical protein